MNIIDSTNPTESTHARRHKNIDLVPGSRDHTHDYELELEQAVADGDKDKVFELAKQWVERGTGESAMRLNDYPQATLEDQMPKNARRYLTTPEAAQYLRKSESWLLRQGDLSYLPGRPNTYAIEDLDAWMERHKHQPLN